MTPKREAELRAILLTVDGRGKEAKRAALDELLRAALDELLRAALSEARTERDAAIKVIAVARTMPRINMLAELFAALARFDYRDAAALRGPSERGTET